MKKLLFGTAASIIAVMLSNSVALSQPSQVIKITVGYRVSDADVVSSAASNVFAQQQLSELEISKGKKKEVRQFADEMLADSANDTADLRGVANDLGMCLPQGLSLDQADRIARLNQAPRFMMDPGYLAELVHSQVEEVAVLEKVNGAAPGVYDDRIVAYAKHRLPQLHNNVVRANVADEKTPAKDVAYGAFNQTY